MEIATAASWFETRRLADGVTLIHEPHIKPYYRCNIWHVRGRDRDLLLDSGIGVVGLRRQVALLAERPLIAVASHGHFDHIGGHWEFPERAIHRAEADILAHPTRASTTVHGGHFAGFGAERYRRLIDDYVAGKRRPGCPG